MFTEQTVVDKIEVLESGYLQVRRAIRIVRDETGEVVSQQYHRASYAPGADVSHEDPRVQLMAQAAWLGTVPAEPPPVVTRVVSARDFARLFTQAERIAIRAAAEQSPALADFYALVELGGTVNLDHPDVAAGLTAMVGAGLLTTERKTAILANQTPQ